MALGLAIAGLLAVFSGGLLLVTPGAAVSTTSSADQSVDYTEWVNQGDPVLTHENVPPGPTTDTERWIPVGEPTRHVTVEAEDEVVGDWSEWTATDLKEPDPANTATYEYREVGNGDGTEDQTVTEMKHFSWTGGPLAEGVVPAVPPTIKGNLDWQPNTAQEPHDNGNGGDKVTWLDEVGSGLHYTGEPGNANWFYFGSFTTVIEGNPETFRAEERTRTITPAVEEVSHLDYSWQKQVRTVVTPPVVTPPVVTPPVVTPPVVEPPVVEPPEVEPAEAEEPATSPQSQSPEAAAPEVLGEQASAPTPQEQVPTVVDAGYAGQPSGDSWGAVLVLGGLLLLTASGAVVAARRT
jgi:hypothetical protein